MSLQVYKFTDSVRKIAPQRKPELFEDFLPKGYELITLSSVPEKSRERLLEAKVNLGTLITLYDDFSDLNEAHNPKLLNELYKIPFQPDAIEIYNLNTREQETLALAADIYMNILSTIQELPNYEFLRPLFEFDLKQFFLANEYASLLTGEPLFVNELENRLYMHHNMGIVLVGMMDLMSIESLRKSEMGRIREVFVLAQRMARIFNVVSTLDREILENDRTNEILVASNSGTSAKQRLLTEVRRRREQVLKYGGPISSFSISAFTSGLMNVQSLYRRMEGLV